MTPLISNNPSGCRALLFGIAACAFFLFAAYANKVRHTDAIMIPFLSGIIEPFLEPSAGWELKPEGPFPITEENITFLLKANGCVLSIIAYLVSLQASIRGERSLVYANAHQTASLALSLVDVVVAVSMALLFFALIMKYRMLADEP